MQVNLKYNEQTLVNFSHENTRFWQNKWFDTTMLFLNQYIKCYQQ